MFRTWRASIEAIRLRCAAAPHRSSRHNLLVSTSCVCRDSFDLYSVQRRWNSSSPPSITESDRRRQRRRERLSSSSPLLHSERAGSIVSESTDGAAATSAPQQNSEQTTAAPLITLRWSEQFDEGNRTPSSSPTSSPASGLHIVLDLDTRPISRFGPACIGFSTTSSASTEAASSSSSYASEALVYEGLTRLLATQQNVMTNSSSLSPAAAVAASNKVRSLTVEIVHDDSAEWIARWIETSDANRHDNLQASQAKGTSSTTTATELSGGGLLDWGSLEELILSYPRGIRPIETDHNDEERDASEPRHGQDISISDEEFFPETKNNESAFALPSASSSGSKKKKVGKQKERASSPTTESLRRLIAALRAPPRNSAVNARGPSSSRVGGLRRLSVKIAPTTVTGTTTTSTADTSSALLSQLDRLGVMVLASLVAHAANTLTVIEFPHLPLQLPPSSWTPPSSAGSGALLSTQHPLEVLCQVIARCAAQLHTLDLSGTACCGVLFAQVPLPVVERMLSVLRELRVLRLSGSHMGDGNIGGVMSALQTSVGGWALLEELDLSAAALSADVGLPLFCEGYRRLSFPEGDSTTSSSSSSVASGHRLLTDEDHSRSEGRLQRLILHSNRISNATCTLLAPALAYCGSSLKVLSLRHNQIVGPASAEECSLAWEGLPALLTPLQPTLESLVLSSNRKLGNQGIAYLATQLPRFPNFKLLDVSRCGLSGESLSHLATVLPVLDQLEVLHIAENNLYAASDPLPKRSTTAADGPSLMEDWGTNAEGKKTLLQRQISVFDPEYMSTRDQTVKSPAFVELERRDREEGRVRYRGDTESAQNQQQEQSGNRSGVRLDAWMSVQDVAKVDRGRLTAAPPLEWPPLARFAFGVTKCIALKELDLSDTGLWLMLDEGSELLQDPPLRTSQSQFSAVQRRGRVLAAGSMALALSQLGSLSVLRLSNNLHVDGWFLCTALGTAAAAAGATMRSHSDTDHDDDDDDDDPLGSSVVEAETPALFLDWVKQVVEGPAAGSEGNKKQIAARPSRNLQQSLRELRLRNCAGLGDVGFLQLCEGPLLCCPQLRVLELAGLGVTEDGWEGLLSDVLEPAAAAVGNSTTATPFLWEELWLDSNSDEGRSRVMSRDQQQRLQDLVAVARLKRPSVLPMLKIVNVTGSV